MKRRSPKRSRDPQETRPSGRVQRRGPRGGQYISPEKRKWIQEKIRTMRHEGYPPLVAIAAAHRMAGIQRPKRPVKHLTPGEHKQLMKARHKDPKLRWIYAGGRRPKSGTRTDRDPEPKRSSRDTASFHSKREAETFQHALFMHGHKRAILAETRTGYAVIYPESVPHHVVQAAKSSVQHRHASSWEEDYPESSPTLRMQRPRAAMHARDPDPRRRKRATTIPWAKRARTSRRVEQLVKKGYSPSYAARRAYQGRDPKLSAAERRRLKPSQFALPKRRALPLNNAKHVRNAAARLSQMHKRGTVTEREYATAHRRIQQAGRRFGVHIS